MLAKCEFVRKFLERTTSTEQTLRCSTASLEQYGTKRDVVESRRPRSNRSATNIAAMAKDSVEVTEASTTQTAVQMAISRRSLQSVKPTRR